MTRMLEADVAGQRFQMLADRGVFWPEQRTLLIADTHFGKEATFRRHSIPVPRGSTAATLKSIANMLRDTQASELVILGDMFHARSSLARDVTDSLDGFFAAHHDVGVRLVLGNHDAHIGTLPTHWSVEVVARHRIGGITLAHHPIAAPQDTDLVVCGHLHPSIRLASASDSMGKLPCFWLSGRRLVLPAIGEFTGTHPIRPRRGDRVWIIAHDQIIEHGLDVTNPRI